MSYNVVVPKLPCAIVAYMDVEEQGPEKSVAHFSSFSCNYSPPEFEETFSRRKSFPFSEVLSLEAHKKQPEAGTRDQSTEAASVSLFTFMRL